MNDTREIITDRMGSWSQQNVTLVWEGNCNCNGNRVSITPDEAEILFKHGLLKNVYRREDGKLGLKTVYADIRSFMGAIVCGIIAPYSRKCMRPEIIDYAKKMGYISDTMTPVKMFSGTKTLIFNSDNTYNIFFKWDDSIVNKIDSEFLKVFTNNFFSDQIIEIKSDGVLMTNLSEKEVFSRKNIDLFRVYDIQLIYLDPSIDKKLLLNAVMRKAFIRLPCNTLSDKYFSKVGNISIPEDKRDHLVFNEFGNCTMKCGKLHYGSDEICTAREYIYQITVPYTEYIRELMVDSEMIINSKYANQGVYSSFSPFSQYFYIRFNENKDLCSSIEREFIILDYAISLLISEDNFNQHQLYSSIISLLEADSSKIFRNEYFSYLKMLKHVLPHKCEFM